MKKSYKQAKLVFLQFNKNHEIEKVFGSLKMLTGSIEAWLECMSFWTHTSMVIVVPYTTLHATQCCSVPYPLQKYRQPRLRHRHWNHLGSLMQLACCVLCCVLTSVTWLCESLSKFASQRQMGNVFWLGDYKYCLHF